MREKVLRKRAFVFALESIIHGQLQYKNYSDKNGGSMLTPSVGFPCSEDIMA
jgi:hypothetical protein